MDAEIFTLEEVEAALVAALPPRDEHCAADNSWLDELIEAVKWELTNNG